MELFCILVLSAGEFREVFISSEDICFVYYLSANSYPRTVSDASYLIMKHPRDATIDIAMSRRLRYLTAGGYFETFEEVIQFYIQAMRYSIIEILW